jgi:hypothetical protein
MRRTPPVFTVQHGRAGRGRASVAPLAGITPPVEPDGAVGFDPGDHNIDDVKAHVDKNPAELDAVLAAERDGKDRTTLIEWLESHAESTTETP